MDSRSRTFSPLIYWLSVSGATILFALACTNISGILLLAGAVYAPVLKGLYSPALSFALFCCGLFYLTFLSWRLRKTNDAKTFFLHSTLLFGVTQIAINVLYWIQPPVLKSAVPLAIQNIEIALGAAAALCISTGLVLWYTRRNVAPPMFPHKRAVLSHMIGGALVWGLTIPFALPHLNTYLQGRLARIPILLFIFAVVYFGVIAWRIFRNQTYLAFWVRILVVALLASATLTAESIACSTGVIPLCVGVMWVYALMGVVLFVSLVVLLVIARKRNKRAHAAVTQSAEHLIQ